MDSSLKDKQNRSSSSLKNIVPFDGGLYLSYVRDLRTSGVHIFGMAACQN